MIATKVAQMLLDEGAQSLVDASEDVKRALVTLYLRARDWDVEVIFNMREFRDSGAPWAWLVENEIYGFAEEAYGAQIETELERLRAEKAA